MRYPARTRRIPRERARNYTAHEPFISGISQTRCGHKSNSQGNKSAFLRVRSGQCFLLLAFCMTGSVGSEMMNKEAQPSDRIDQEILAADALERARLLPPGPERNEALKLASLLRCTAESQGPVFAKRGRPRK
jgi:hypothetical protein